MSDDMDQIKNEHQQGVTAALARVKEGGTYPRRDGTGEVVVTSVDHVIGYVTFRRVAGPGEVAPRRDLYIFDFLASFEA